MQSNKGHYALQNSHLSIQPSNASNASAAHFTSKFVLHLLSYSGLHVPRLSNKAASGNSQAASLSVIFSEMALSIGPFCESEHGVYLLFHPPDSQMRGAQVKLCVDLNRRAYRADSIGHFPILLNGFGADVGGNWLVGHRDEHSNRGGRLVI